MTRTLQKFFIFLILLFSIVGNTQNFFYHLMPKQPTVNFTLASQGASEANGIFAPDWHAVVNAWDKRRKIEITPVTTALTNFPLLVKLDATKIIYANLQAAAQDLRFVDGTGTLLPYEIENWNVSGESNIWVNVPSMAASPTVTNIWMYYGNGTAVDAQSATNTWSNSYAKVLNLKGTSGAAIANSATLTASFGNNATAGNVNGTGMSFIAGAIHTAVQTDGVDDWLDIGNDASLNFGASAAFTISAWVKTTENVGPFLAFRDSATGTAMLEFGIGYNGSTTVNGAANILVRDQSGNPFAVLTGPVINNGIWHQYTVSRNAGNVISLYVDGAYVGNTSSAGTGGSITANLRALGSDRYWVQVANGTVDQQYLNAGFDQLEISNTQRSADWLLQSYNAVQDNVNIIYREESNSASLVNATLLLSSAYPQNVTVPFTVTGTSTSGADHNLASGSAIVTAGNTTQNIPIRIYSDNLTEGNESVIVSIGTPTNGRQGTDIPVHTVTITDDVNVAPVANNDTVNLTSFSAVQINVISNDTDANGDALWIQSNTSPTVGTITKSGRTFTYTPTTDFPATDSFTYTVTDKRGGTSTATVTLNYQIPFTWTGAGGDSNWNTAANWLGGVVPGAGNTAYFNNSCSTNCDPLMNVAVSLSNLSMNSSYTGTITQAAGNSVTITPGGWLQRAGTFTGGNSNITARTMNILGGTFSASSANLTINPDSTIITNGITVFKVSNTATFNHTAGTLVFLATSQWAATTSHQIDLGANLTVNNLTFNFNDTTSAYGFNWMLVTANKFIVNGNLLLQRISAGGSFAVRGGAIDLYGNLSALDGVSGGTTVVTMKSTGAQTYSGMSGTCAPPTIVDKTAGAVTSATANAGFEKLILTQGSFTAPTGTLQIMPYGSNSISGATVFSVAAAATFTHNGGTVDFIPVVGWLNSVGYTIDVNSTETFNHLKLRLNDSTGYYFTWTIAAGDTLNVLGDLTTARVSSAEALTINGGSINVSGNFNSQAGSNGGSTLITMTGTNAESLSQTAGAIVPGAAITVNKASNTVAQTANTSFSTAGQDLTITSGTYNLAGFNLTVNDVLTIGAAGKLLCNGGTVAAGSRVVTGEVSCGPTIGITWTGNAGDNNWGTASNWTNNTIPGATDVAIFNGMCAGANCNVNIASNISVKGINMMASYTGTITQTAGFTMTMGASGWSQAGGTFTGGSGQFRVNGPFLLSAGTFTSTTGTLMSVGNWTVSGGTFNHNNGTLQFNDGNTNIHPTFTVGTANYNHVIINGWGSTNTLVGTMTVLGNLTVGEGYGGSQNGGTILASGNVSFVNKGYGGSTLIKLVGSSSQTITGVVNSFTPSIEIASTGGTVTFSGTFNMYRNFTYTTGTVDTTTSTINFYQYSCSSGTITPGNIAFNNVGLIGYCANLTLVGTLTVNGALTIDDTYTSPGTITGGTIEAKGNVSITNYGKTGTVLLKLSGSGNQTMTGTSSASIPTFEIASTGGTVSFAGTLLFPKNFTYTSGVVDPGTSTFYFTGPNSGTVSYVVGTMNFYNVTFAGNNVIHNLNSGTMNLLGALTLADINAGAGGLNSGTINVAGNVNLSSSGKIGSAVVKLNGNANQTVTGVSSAWIPNLEILSTGGTVGFAGTIQSRTFYTYTSGTVDAGTSTLLLTGTPSGTHTHSFGGLNYNNVTFAGNTTHHQLNSGTLNVLGTLTFTDANGTVGNVNSGTINAGGNVVFSSYGKSGNATLNLNGAVSSTLTTATTAKLLATSHVVAKTGGAQVSLVGDANYTTAGMDFTINSGTLNMAGYDFNVNDVLTIAASGTLACSGGDFTAGTLTNSGTIVCPGYGGYPFNWTGAAADGNWSSAGNWQGGVTPGAADVVVFNDTYCGVNCNASLTTNTTVKGILMESPFTGSITQNNGVTLTVGTKAFKQYAGTFSGGNSNITYNGSFILSGGTYTATSATTLPRNVTISGAPTFNHNSGTWTFNTASTVTSISSAAFNNVNFAGNEQSFTIGGILRANGNLSLTDTGFWVNYAKLTGGTIESAGNISNSGLGKNGTTILKLVGNASGQTITGSATSLFPTLVIDTGANSVTFSGTINLVNNYTVTSVGTFTATGSTLAFRNQSGGGTQTIIPGTVNYGNVSFLGWDTTFNLSGGIVNVLETLTVSDVGTWAGLRNVNSGTLKAYGDVSVINNGSNGNASVQFLGGTNSNLTMSATGYLPGGAVTVNKTAGASLILASNSRFNGSASQDLTITAGTLDMAGFNLAAGRNISNSDTLKRGNNPTCGTLTYTGSYTGNAAVCP